MTNILPVKYWITLCDRKELKLKNDNKDYTFHNDSKKSYIIIKNIKQLIKADINLYQTEEYEIPPLAIAMLFDDTFTNKMLKLYKYDNEFINKTIYPVAILCERYKLVKRLLETGVDVNTVVSKDITKLCCGRIGSVITRYRSRSGDFSLGNIEKSDASLSLFSVLYNGNIELLDLLMSYNINTKPEPNMLNILSYTGLCLRDDMIEHITQKYILHFSSDVFDNDDLSNYVFILIISDEHTYKTKNKSIELLSNHINIYVLDNVLKLVFSSDEQYGIFYCIKNYDCINHESKIYNICDNILDDNDTFHLINMKMMRHLILKKYNMEKYVPRCIVNAILFGDKKLLQAIMDNYDYETICFNIKNEINRVLTTQ
jgi:hypothetical protein